DRLEHLRFRSPGYHQRGLFDGARKVGPYRRGIEAERTARFRIPKVRIVDSGSPRAFHQAYETVLPLNGSFIASFAENKNFGFAGDGVRSSTPRQLYLLVPIRHQVLFEWGHARIRRFGVLRFCLPRCTEHDEQSDAPECAGSHSFSFHDFSWIVRFGNIY